MKVICLKDYYRNHGLTIGKLYDAEKGTNLTLNLSYYLLKNDHGRLTGYPVEYFIPLSEFRKQKLKKLNSI